MPRKKRYPVQLPENLYQTVEELTPEGHTLISTLWDAVNLLKEKRKNGKTL